MNTNQSELGTKGRRAPVLGSRRRNRISEIVNIISPARPRPVPLTRRPVHQQPIITLGELTRVVIARIVGRQPELRPVAERTLRQLREGRR